MKRIIAALFAATLLLAACGGSDSAGSGSGSGSSASADFNDADVAFAQGMIPHHKQAVEMADLALKNASSDKVTALAKKIKAAQDPEIKTMEGWLSDWGQSETTSSSDMGGMNHGSDTTMGSDMGGMGMMSDKDMADLEAATGSEFDTMFLKMMVKHHKGAVEMAKIEKADGQNADAKDLADKIIAAQEGEITEMQALLDGGV
ncbi:DUF305 domain-containing protein [Aquihabitans sp. G128]|uniref:DUF305 domain-containing protein n=1 Tax=Aquihabitans sp. G128 TaxID=2849779 RepID=UPI001C241655|nr:DUF305 domain-containing protein [Aquihabitans sp. G128]QXC60631.1 DUF305 domain-containing protein [Aquihabitans sp. G128]